MQSAQVEEFATAKLLNVLASMDMKARLASVLRAPTIALATALASLLTT
jgi:hypothetical protein